MENLDCRKLFDIGAKIHLSSEFIEDGKINSLREDCINIQEKQGFLKVVDVTKDNVIVKGTTKNHYLRLSDIKLYQLGTCDNKYENGLNKINKEIYNLWKNKLNQFIL